MRIRGEMIPEQGKVRRSESQMQMETSLGQQEECLRHGDGTAQEESF